jgi:hypothetical protein
MPALTPVQRKDVHTPPRSSRRTPCAPPAIIVRASILSILHSPPPTGARHTKGGKRCHSPPSARPARSPAIVARASILPILHSPTPTGTRRTKGGKCCQSPPPHGLRPLPRESRERLYFLYFTPRDPRAPDAPRAESAATPRPRTARALSRESRASVYTSYTSLADTHGRQTHQGREVLPLPAPSRHAEPVAGQRLRSA